MKTVPELTQRWWYRLLKLFYVTLYLIIAITVGYTTVEEAKPREIITRVPVERNDNNTVKTSEKKSLQEIFKESTEYYYGYKEVKTPITGEQVSKAFGELELKLFFNMGILYTCSYLLHRSFKYVFVKEKFFGYPDIKIIVLTLTLTSIFLAYGFMTYRY